MKTINFNLKNIITYQEYESIINDCKKVYEKKRKEIDNLYQQMINNKSFINSLDITKKHQKVIIDLIDMIIKRLKISNLEFGIYLSNSFARITNLFDSDIDINFMYEDDEMQVYEELISSILFKVLGTYRDFVHDSISHRISKELYNELEELKIRLEFSDLVIEDDVTIGNRFLIYRIYHTKKNQSEFIKYYIKSFNEESINEWIYYQQSIYDQDDYLKSLFDYITNLELLLRKHKINENIDLLVKEIDKEKELLEQINWNEISDLKRLLKNHAFKIFSEYLIINMKNKNGKVLESFNERLEQVDNQELAKLIRIYFGKIMALNYICDLYGVEFRTRYKKHINNSFHDFYKSLMDSDIKSLKEDLSIIYEIILKELKLIDKKEDNQIFDVNFEFINIENYSPLSHINYVSQEYKEGYFLLPFIKENGVLIPIHPDTLNDLGISRKNIEKEILVYPTSSTRTVYYENENICYKLPVARQITRSIRDLKEKELKRSEIAGGYLSKYPLDNFSFLEEKCFYHEKEIFNYIIRYMPNKKIYPWFYVIVTDKFSKEFKLKVIENIISIWMYYASVGIYFESFHTQNILVDDDANIYYRDLSDIRIIEEELMRPSYFGLLANKLEFHSIFFDRSVLKQNIEHFIKYQKDINDEDIKRIQIMIQEAINKYNVLFPDYSMDYDKNKSGHYPVKCDLPRLRKINKI